MPPATVAVQPPDGITHGSPLPGEAIAHADGVRSAGRTGGKSARSQRRVIAARHLSASIMSDQPEAG